MKPCRYGRWGAMLSPLGLVLAALVSMASNCDGHETAPPAIDAGSEAGSIDRAECPDAPPADGDACALPEGSSCSFGLCPVLVAQCTRGYWRFAHNAPPPLNCPLVPPESDSDCPPCWPDSMTCTYGSTDCSAPDASVNTAVATCPSGKWVLDIRPCRDGGG
ncbi:MAG: hypothetical protein FWD69_03610 [Polyangiaceae bacterium]|nr:hypothetical protein [Polyangiaceae bacterium]